MHLCTYQVQQYQSSSEVLGKYKRTNQVLTVKQFLVTVCQTSAGKFKKLLRKRNQKIFRRKVIVAHINKTMENLLASESNFMEPSSLKNSLKFKNLSEVFQIVPWHSYQGRNFKIFFSQVILAKKSFFQFLQAPCIQGGCDKSLIGMFLVYCLRLERPKFGSASGVTSTSTRTSVLIESLNQISVRVP